MVVEGYPIRTSPPWRIAKLPARTMTLAKLSTGSRFLFLLNHITQYKEILTGCKKSYTTHTCKYVFGKPEKIWKYVTVGKIILGIHEINLLNWAHLNHMMCCFNVLREHHIQMLLITDFVAVQNLIVSYSIALSSYLFIKMTS